MLDAGCLRLHCKGSVFTTHQFHCFTAPALLLRLPCTSCCRADGEAVYCLYRRALREEMYRASITRASSGDIDNTPVIEKVGCWVAGWRGGWVGVFRLVGQVCCLPALCLPAMQRHPPHPTCQQPPLSAPPAPLHPLPPCHPAAPQILSLRREKAQLLGYESFADVSMASKVGGWRTLKGTAWP